MASPNRRIKNALQETRFLLLGAQVLLSFQGRAALLPGYEHLSPLAKQLSLWGLIPAELLLVLLLAPLPFHNITEDGRDSERMHSFTTQMARWGLFTFAFSLGINLAIAADPLFGMPYTVVVGVTMIVLALLAWFGVEWYARTKNKGRFSQEGQKGMEEKKDENKDEMPELSDRIDQTLSEGGMVVPGNTALLGFGFITMMVDSFLKLPQPVQLAQFIGVCCIALSTILIMTPSAYHRLVDHGEDTEEFYKLATNLLTIALIPFAIGVNCGLFVVGYQVTHSYLISGAVSIGMLLLFYGVWFGYTAFKRQERERDGGKQQTA